MRSRPSQRRPSHGRNAEPAFTEAKDRWLQGDVLHMERMVLASKQNIMTRSAN
jgi:hypothetical protein